jgi:hypothetical protein
MINCIITPRYIEPVPEAPFLTQVLLKILSRLTKQNIFNGNFMKTCLKPTKDTLMLDKGDHADAAFPMGLVNKPICQAA